ncbi:MAG: rhodanese-related sulfurtransferase [Cocleimonas sp.]|jgi:rhodanese-related sulfurtransferase
MRNLKIIAVIFLLSLVFTTATHANTETIIEKKSPTALPVMQAGGYSNISNEKMQELLDQGILLIDIRREEEWKHTGIVKGSKTITFFDKTGRVNQDFVPQFTAIAKKDQPIMLICRTGARTQAASAAIAQQLGYKKVMNVTTGIMGWIGEKRPVTSY